MPGVISSRAQWEAFLTRAHREPVVAIAIQARGPDPLIDSVKTIHLATASEDACLDADAIGDHEKLRQMLRPLTDGSHYVKAFHNAKPTLRFMLGMGLRPVRIFDSMLAEQLLSGGQMTTEPSLPESAGRVLRTEIPEQWVAASGATALLRQARLIYELRLKLIPRLVEAGLVRCAQLEFECSVVTAAMEQAGIGIDVRRLDGLIAKAEQRMATATRGFCDVFGSTHRGLFGETAFNLHADQQVLAVLQKHGVPLKRVKRSAVSPLLAAYPGLQHLLDYRAASHDRALDGYRKSVHPLTGRLHATYSQLAAATGRYGCSNPNMQSFPNTPKHRACIVPADEHMFVVADYSQIELRIVAQLSQDARMLAAFRRGEDLHVLTASILADKEPAQVTRQERQAAKAVNFGLIYAMGPQGLANYARHTYGVEMTLQQATHFRRRFFAAYSGVAGWHMRTQKQQPAIVRTLSGRVRRIEPWQLSQALNSPVQGTGADILKQALVLLFPALYDLQAQIVGVVHDEILVEAPKERINETKDIVNQQMEKAARVFLPDVPCPVESRIAPTWGEVG